MGRRRGHTTYAPLDAYLQQVLAEQGQVRVPLAVLEELLGPSLRGGQRQWSLANAKQHVQYYSPFVARLERTPPALVCTRRGTATD